MGVPMSDTLEPAMTAALAAPGGAALGGALDEADRAILRTVVYSSLFQAVLTLEKLERSLMDVRLEQEEIRDRILRRPLSEVVILEGPLVHLRGREEWLALREERRRRSDELVREHRLLLRMIARFPFVR